MIIGLATKVVLDQFIFAPFFIAGTIKVYKSRFLIADHSCV